MEWPLSKRCLLLLMVACVLARAMEVKNVDVDRPPPHPRVVILSVSEDDEHLFARHLLQKILGDEVQYLLTLNVKEKSTDFEKVVRPAAEKAFATVNWAHVEVFVFEFHTNEHLAPFVFILDFLMEDAAKQQRVTLKIQHRLVMTCRVEDRHLHGPHIRNPLWQMVSAENVINFTPWGVYIKEANAEYPGRLEYGYPESSRILDEAGIRLEDGVSETTLARLLKDDSEKQAQEASPFSVLVLAALKQVSGYANSNKAQLTGMPLLPRVLIDDRFTPEERKVLLTTVKVLLGDGNLACFTKHIGQQVGVSAAFKTWNPLLTTCGLSAHTKKQLVKERPVLHKYLSILHAYYEKQSEEGKLFISMQHKPKDLNPNNPIIYAWGPLLLAIQHTPEHIWQRMHEVNVWIFGEHKANELLRMLDGN